MDAPPLRTFELLDGILYGPVRSRRLGASLGVNLLPFGLKLCSFNCVYCQCGWSDRPVGGPYRFPTAEEVGAALRGWRTAPGALDSITLSGNGECTLHPDFLGVVRAILAARDEAMPGVPVRALSNGSFLDRPGVVEGLNLLDERLMKLDAGSGAINAPIAGLGYEAVVERLPRLRPFIVQAMFVRGRRDNTDEASVTAWIEAVRRAGPAGVQVYSVDRIPADPEILRVDRGTLEEIARKLTERTGISCRVF
jgi:wyosine [tRNA(Phe)-imidazoG37] synthetase (radical SAM superfamily)